MTLKNLVRILSTSFYICIHVCAQVVDIEDDQYKRIHQNAVEAVLAGNTAGAIEALEGLLAGQPDDADTWYTLAIAQAHHGDAGAAVESLKQALAHGLPVGRVSAGKYNLLAPLQDDAAFQELLRDKGSPLVHGPMVGNVTDASASFWVRTAVESEVQVRVSREPSMAGAVVSKVVRSTAANDHTAVATVESLAPETRYHYQVAVDNVLFPDNGTWSFKTFPLAGAPTAFRVAFGGGAGYTPQHERMWTTIKAYEPRAFLALGDNVYIDHPEQPAIQRFTYYRRQSRPEYRGFVASIGVFSIWDDHDFGTNDCFVGAGADDPAWKRPVWRLFMNNWVNPSYGGGEKNPGCWYNFRIGDVDFIMLDGRYYRTDPEGEHPSMLGPVQKKWLLDTLKAATGTFKVLASPVPWAMNTKPGSLDTWDGFPDERAEIFNTIVENQIEGVVLLSADRHRSDLWKIDWPGLYPLFECESSRLTNIHVHEKMPGALFSYNESQSFGLLNFDTTFADPELRYTIVNIDGRGVFEHKIHRSELDFDVVK
ncbi:MAG: alkaline phosphatase D family protein [Candidatus Hydrogenedentes bacterium]|nr:alkaline phosphatase D family protein [Candidatus Hydrogenedentota bacterium]